MLRNNKGQGLVEFAFMLPVLLMLMLGIIEIGRIMWGYVTVQAAAREAARYAVTGKPYILEDTSSTDPVCQTPDGEDAAGATEPWLCHPMVRTRAIEEIAFTHGGPLGISRRCYTPSFDDCTDIPNAFAVQVSGQIISPTISLTQPISILGHAGTSGLMVEVQTYYNLTMLDPIYDLILGGNFLTLRGSIQMQNEGIESLLGSIPPPAISDPILPSNSPFSGYDPNNMFDPNNPYDPDNPNFDPDNPPPVIKSLSGYSLFSGDKMRIRLENHDDTNQYDIYLGEYKICADQSISNSSEQLEIAPSMVITITYAEFDCFATVPPGSYPLYSTLAGTPNEILAGAGQEVEIKNNAADIVLKDSDTSTASDTWAAHSPLEVDLIRHPGEDGPFYVYFDYGGPHFEMISLASSDATSVLWTVPAVSDCQPCPIQTRRQSDESTVYAETDIYINPNPEIILGGNSMVFAQGEKLWIYLKGHTPGLQYDLKLSGPNGVVLLGRTEATDANGDTLTPVEWTVYQVHPDWPEGFPNGFYDITSHPAVGDAPDLNNLTTENQIAILEGVEINTPEGPYITVDGGYSWPIGSYINIRVHQHPPDTYYLKFGPWPVPGESGNTFETDTNETAVAGYRIPLTATETVSTTYIISSFLASTDETVATRAVEVSPQPLITVLEGERVLPDATITIRLTNHAPQASYTVFYANKELFNILTDQIGQAEQSYDLSDLPTSPTPDLSNPLNYGNSYEMYSQQVVDTTKVATTTLALKAADLVITRVDLPAEANINSTVPVTLTIQNLLPVPIARYFDIDFYLNPSPLLPSPEIGHNFPGDVKRWENLVAPEGSFTVTVQDELFIGEYGEQEIYGFADTSDFVIEETSDNNVLSNTLVISCTPTMRTDTFNSLDFILASSWPGPSMIAQAAIAQTNEDSFWSVKPAGLGFNTPNGDQVSLIPMGAAPQLKVSPTSLSFSATEGGSNPASQSFTLLDETSKMTNWAATDNANWLILSDTSGNPNPTTVDAFVNITGLTPGTYNAAITINGYDKSAKLITGSPVTVNVTLVINPAPTATHTPTSTPTPTNTPTPTQTPDPGDTPVPTPSPSLTDWTAQQYGDAEAQPTPTTAGGYLILSSDGTSTFGSSDNNLVFHQTNPITTEAGLDVMIQIFNAPSNVQYAGAGLEIRNGVEANSIKLDIGLTWDPAASSFVVEASYRGSAGADVSSIAYGDQVDLNGGSSPVWLRIQRQAGTDIFNLYYLQQNGTPTEADWGDPYATINLDMGDPVYAGLYNASYQDGSYQSSKFDNFTVMDTSHCPAGQGQPETEIPPGMTICTNPLTERSFENPPLSYWKFAFAEGVAVSRGNANSGLYKILAPTFDGAFFNPYFYQKITMPGWILSNTTTLDVNLYKNINNLATQGSSNDPDDRFYAVLATSPDLDGFLLTEPAQIANGVMDIPTYDPDFWQQVTVRLHAAAGVNLEDYENQPVYFLLYNNSNETDGCPPFGAHCHATKYYFDDMDLTACTTEPLPYPIDTRITGILTLHRSDGSKEQIPGVKVWAYAEGGEVYRTFTIQNGVYNFFNLLPVTPEGTKYFIYAEHHLIDPLTPNEIETLTASTEVILKSTNDNTNTLEVNLDLYAPTN